VVRRRVKTKRLLRDRLVGGVAMCYVCLSVCLFVCSSHAGCNSRSESCRRFNLDELLHTCKRQNLDVERSTLKFYGSQKTQAHFTASEEQELSCSLETKRRCCSCGVPNGLSLWTRCFIYVVWLWYKCVL